MNPGTLKTFFNKKSALQSLAWWLWFKRMRSAWVKHGILMATELLAGEQKKKNQVTLQEGQR